MFGYFGSRLYSIAQHCDIEIIKIYSATNAQFWLNVWNVVEAQYFCKLNVLHPIFNEPLV